MRGPELFPALRVVAGQFERACDQQFLATVMTPDYRRGVAANCIWARGFPKCLSRGAIDCHDEAVDIVVLGEDDGQAVGQLVLLERDLRQGRGRQKQGCEHGVHGLLRLQPSRK